MADETTPTPTGKADDPAGKDEGPAAPAPSGSPLPTAPVFSPDTGYTADGVPTFEGVREKIETRYATALGATELAEETPEGRSAAERYGTIRKAAAERLDEIRAAMHNKD